MCTWILNAVRKIGGGWISDAVKIRKDLADTKRARLEIERLEAERDRRIVGATLEDVKMYDEKVRELERELDREYLRSDERRDRVKSLVIRVEKKREMMDELVGEMIKTESEQELRVLENRIEAIRREIDVWIEAEAQRLLGGAVSEGTRAGREDEKELEVTDQN